MVDFKYQKNMEHIKNTESEDITNQTTENKRYELLC